MKMRYYKYARLLSNGEWQYFTAPTIFGPEDVAGHCSHSVLCVFLARGKHVYDTKLGKIEGPTWLVWGKTERDYVAHWPNLDQVPHRLAYQYA